MLFKKLNLDERAVSTTRYAAAIWLGVTQILLAGVVFYRLYVLGQPDEQLRDFQAVLAISLFGYLGLQLFLGGVMPALTWKGAVILWAILAGAIAIFSIGIHGWPAPSDWSSTWLPGLLGPALLVGAYALFAWLGQHRIERLIERDVD